MWAVLGESDNTRSLLHGDKVDGDTVNHCVYFSGKSILTIEGINHSPVTISFDIKSFIPHLFIGKRATTRIP